jgi:hypothetical protein
MKIAEPKTAAPACIDGRIMDAVASDALIKWAVGKDCSEDTTESLERELNDFAAELAGPTSSRFERTLAELAALDWFALRLHQAKYGNRYVSDKGMAIDQSEHAQRRIDRAHRRLISTLRTLATVRRLTVPALQVNVSANQINVAQAGG